MKQFRKHLIHWLFEKTMLIYCKFKKKQAWNISVKQLMKMPTNTFGYRLGIFLHAQGFELIPKVERHDAYHLITGFNTTVEDEIALQYACYGNGKRTPYLWGVLLLGTLLLPDYWSYYLKAYSFGKNSHSFHHFDYKKVLPLDFQLFHDALFSEKEIKSLEEFRQRILQKEKTKLTYI